MSVYQPVEFVRNANGVGAAPIRQMPEKASSTFIEGTPLVLDSGYVTESADPIVGAIVGFSVSRGQNLTSSGVAEDGYSEGHPPNQPYARTIPVGAWMKTGLATVIAKISSLADPIFSAHLKLGQVYTDAMIGTRYELNKDATTGCWSIDYTDSGTTPEHVCKVIGVDPRSPNSATLGARVLFTLY